MNQHGGGVDWVLRVATQIDHGGLGRRLRDTQCARGIGMSPNEAAIPCACPGGNGGGSVGADVARNVEGSFAGGGILRGLRERRAAINGEEASSESCTEAHGN